MGCGPTDPEATAPEPLTSEFALIRTLAPGETLRFATDAQAGDLLDLTVAQLGLDVVMTVRTSGDARLALRPSVRGVEGAERLVHIAQDTGRYIGAHAAGVIPS